MSELQIFDVEGSGMRFGVAADGRPYVVAEDFTPSLGYSRARDALRMVDDDEKGAQIVRTPGGPQEMKVLFEDGIWELIFLSRRPEAKAIKKRVKAILRQIRETGSYSATPVELDELEVAERYVASLRRNKELAAENAKLRVKAAQFDDWLNGKGCYLIGTVAKMLGVKPKAMWDFLYAEKVLINRPGNKRHREPYSRPDTEDWFEIKGVPPERANGHATRTTYLTPYGAEQVRLRLIKRGLLPHEQLALIEGTA